MKIDISSVTSIESSLKVMAEVCDFFEDKENNSLSKDELEKLAKDIVNSMSKEEQMDVLIGSQGIMLALASDDDIFELKQSIS